MPPHRTLLTFRELVESEHDQLENATELEAGPKGSYDKSEFAGIEELDRESGEPWLAKKSVDRVGLALSGGGIRSATFGLGLLQSLARRRVLGMVDYVSTVSGGGYLGGFWTAWKQRTGGKGVFPGAEAAPGSTERESPEIRHLREFSRFLAPRIGLNEPETWNAVAAVLGGMFPALLATMAAIALVVYAWLGLGYLALGYWPLERLVSVTWPVRLHGPFFVGAGGVVLAFALSLLVPKVRTALGEEGKWVGNWLVSYVGVFGGALMLLGVCYWHAPIWLTSHMAVFGLASIGLHVLFEWAAWKDNRCERGPHEVLWQATYWVVALATTALGMWLVDQCSGFMRASKQPDGLRCAMGFAPAIAWAGCALAVSMMWAVIEGIARLVEALFHSKDPAWKARGELRLRRSQMQEKLTATYLKWATVFAAIVLVWYSAFWAEYLLQKKAGGVNPIGASAGLTAIFTGLFAYFREWLTKPDKKSVGGTMWQMFKDAFKQWLPMAAATAGALCLILFTILVMKYYGKHYGEHYGLGRSVMIGFLCSFAVVVLTVKFFDPAYVSLHCFYRARIARAYLGAAFVEGRDWERSLEREKNNGDAIKKAKDDLQKKIAVETNDRRKKELEEGLDRLKALRKSADAAQQRKPSSCDNRFTSERPLDDLCLTSLEQDFRPIHLICCAANHLSGDDLPNLYRGARSAVLSQRGITLGDATVKPADWDPPLMLSSAQTASAAAFNSQMGELSFRLGRGGAFLMTALNLRLGMWVMNPVKVRADEDQRLLYKGWLRKLWNPSSRLGARLKREVKIFLKQMPGLAFYFELMRTSKCLPGDRRRHLHLSDGAHFENLGLYELIRRHCTYIIVSDAGQDETVAFDDLGNVIRRVREDFGVEIELDLDPLRPNDQRISGQHAVVGTIYYDGIGGNDTGILIYIKPSLTGDEPGDIQQYRTRNKKFPHESTGDQFFSEAQWESYRRLGEHVGDTIFSFVDPKAPMEVAAIFKKAQEDSKRGFKVDVHPEICRCREDARHENEAPTATV